MERKHYNYIYFYEKASSSIPILTGSSQLLENIIFLENGLKEKIEKDFPESQGNLSVWIEGTIFKVVSS